ncbi:hypothetical protein [Atopobium sp. oral taxon 416]|uniref:hypothetical protein n=1 Tax=Atopobium sp. oral taxon 416 TaxID=712157 RepID=UPI001BA6D57E|nr:hypothetical protein [Atopobium sp. oral taxon 416]QUC02835.1 hypothetical protein J4859_12590 [Atopobium sp. oral taxon 416]
MLVAAAVVAGILVAYKRRKRGGLRMRRSFSRRSFLALGGVAVMSVGLTMAGYSPMQGEPTVQVQSSDFSSQPEERDLMGSADPCDVRVGLIMGPPSMGLSQFMLAVQNGKTENNFEFTVDGVDYISLSASLNQGDFDIATLPSNIGPILYNNKELQNSYQVISVNNLGVLYVMTTVSSISPDAACTATARAVRPSTLSRHC